MRSSIPFSFIHASDLHLDSPFRIHQGRNNELREILLDAGLAAFEKLCDAAIERDVDFIVLAGDIYDGMERGIRAQLRLRREFGRLLEHDIKVFVAFGNHDPIDAAKEIAIEWPDNLHIFPSDPTTITLTKHGVDYVQVTGVSYKSRDERRNLALLFPDMESSSIFQIAVLHANVGASPDHGNYAPATIADLESKGFDYWALGHIHKRTILCEDPLIVYPGNIQGLHLKPSELGVKGCELVEVSEVGVSHTLLPLAAVYFDHITVDVENYESLDILIGDCVESVINVRDPHDTVPLVARIIFVGRASLGIENGLSDPEAIESELRDQLRTSFPPVFLDKLELKCGSSRSLEDLQSLSDVVVEILHEIERWESDPRLMSTFSLGDTLTKVAVSKARRAGLSDSLGYGGEDIEAAKALLSRLFEGGER